MNIKFHMLTGKFDFLSLPFHQRANILKDLVETIFFCHFNFKDAYSEQKIKTEKEFESTEKLIKSRVEEIIFEIRDIERIMLNVLSETKEKTKQETERQYKTVRRIEDLIQVSHQATDQANLKSTMYKYQEFLIELNNCSAHIDGKIHRRCKFVPGTWSPSLENIGKIIESDLRLKPSNYVNTRLPVIEISKNICNLSANYPGCAEGKIEKLFNFNDKFLILILTTNNLKSNCEIVVLDENFSIKKRISSIGSRKFKVCKVSSLF
jgi:hypothetical protein